MKNLIKKAYLLIVLLFLYAPIAVLVVFSFNASKSRGHWGGFTLKWYSELFADPAILSALYNTIAIAVLSALVATVIGTAAATAIHSMPPVKKRIVMLFTNIPVLNPDIVTGIALMILYISFFSFIKHGSLGFGTLLLSHIIFNVPYVILSVMPKLRQLDANLYEAALDLGSTPINAFFRIIIPQITPGIVTGAIFAFTLSLDDFIISFFTTGSGVANLSISIYTMARRGINPKINALSTIMFLVVLVLLFLVDKREKASLKKISTLGKEHAQ